VLKRSSKSFKWKSPTNGFIIDVRGGIAFSGRAHRLIKLNPKIPMDVFRAFLKIKESRGNFSKSGSVLLENLFFVSGEIGNGFFKMKIGKRNFFVKVIENKRIKQKFSPNHDLALSQFNSLIEARELIKNSVFSKSFDVIVPQFAFVSGKYSFLVTDFVNLQTMSDILYGKDPALAKRVHDELPIFQSGAKFLERREFFDLGVHNTFYSPKTGKFVFFDLRKHFE
jgi:hypothetical protein